MKKRIEEIKADREKTIELLDEQNRLLKDKNREIELLRNDLNYWENKNKD